MSVTDCAIAHFPLGTPMFRLVALFRVFEASLNLRVEGSIPSRLTTISWTISHVVVSPVALRGRMAGAIFSGRQAAAATGRAVSGRAPVAPTGDRKASMAQNPHDGRAATTTFPLVFGAGLNRSLTLESAWDQSPHRHRCEPRAA